MSRHNEILPIRNIGALVCGGVVGVVGGLIGLGGAEFRLPLLIGVFHFATLEAVILNKAMSLVVVAAALSFRSASVPFAAIAERWDIIGTLLIGSLGGAWTGADWATKIKGLTLSRVLSVLLVGIAAVLVFRHDSLGTHSALLEGAPLTIVGASLGFGIGVVASLMGVAGGELLIPTIVILFGENPMLAGSLSLVVSLPTMIVGFTRYSRDNTFGVIRAELSFISFMAAGSIAGAFIGGKLLGLIPNIILLPSLSVLLLVSAAKIWRHE